MKGKMPVLRDRIRSAPGILALSVIGIILLAGMLQGAKIVGLFAAATSSLALSPAVMYFIPYSSTTLSPGETVEVDVNINARVPVNALGITIKFPTDMIDVVGFSKQRSFLDLWTEDTSIREDSGEIHFSGGTTRTGGLLGTSTALTITLQAKRPGTATLTFENADVYASDGTGALLASKNRSITFTIPSPAPSPTVTIAAPASSGALVLSNSVSAPQAPSADFNNDGSVNLVDMSILVLHTLGSYDTRYDLNMDGVITISDLSILYSKSRSKK